MPVTPKPRLDPSRPLIERRTLRDIISRSGFAGDEAAQGLSAGNCSSISSRRGLGQTVEFGAKVSRIDVDPSAVRIIVLDLYASSRKGQQEPRIVTESGIVRVVKGFRHAGTSVKNPVSLNFEDFLEAGSIAGRSCGNGCGCVVGEVVVEDAAKSIGITARDEILNRQKWISIGRRPPGARASLPGIGGK